MVDLALLLPKFGMLQMLDEKDPNKRCRNRNDNQDWPYA